MHRYARACENMHRSICTHMQEHSNASTDQHAQMDMHRYAQVRKNRHILTLTGLQKKMLTPGLFNISRHAQPSKDKHRSRLTDMH